MLIKIFSLTLLLVCVLPLDVFAENYVCKDNQNKLFIKFDYNNKQVHSANKQIYKYNIKNDLIKKVVSQKWQNSLFSTTVFRKI